MDRTTPSDSRFPRHIQASSSNSPPVLNNPGSFAIDVGEPLSVQLAATDGDLPTQVLRYRFAGGQPAGMTLDPITGGIAWTPGDENEELTYAISVQAYDDQIPEGVATRILYVEVLKKPGLPPVFDPFPPLSWKTNGVHRVTLSASDPENEPVTLTADLSALTEGWPSFHAVDGSGNGTITWGIWGVPPGTYQVPLTASTDRQSVSVVLSIEVTEREAITNYNDWAASFELTPLEALIDHSVNPTGLDTLLIYAFGFDPRHGSAPGQPGPRPQALSGSEGLRFTLPEGGAGRIDLNYYLERSTSSLDDWQTVATKIGHSPWTGVGSRIDTTPIKGDLTEVVLTTAPLPPTEPTFLRLRIGFPNSGPTEFETWINGFTSPDDGPNGDANSDGIVNYLSWSLGHASPLAIAPVERASIPHLVGTPAGSAFRVKILGGAKADVRYLIETSRDLRSWNPVAIKQGSAPWFSEIPITPVAAGATDEAWDFDLLFGPGGFVRLRVDPRLRP